MPKKNHASKRAFFAPGPNALIAHMQFQLEENAARQWRGWYARIKKQNPRLTARELNDLAAREFKKHIARSNRRNQKRLQAQTRFLGENI